MAGQKKKRASDAKAPGSRRQKGRASGAEAPSEGLAEGQSTPNARADEEPAAVWVDIERLTPWIRNPRRNDANVQRVASSIRRFGFSAPIIARAADGEVIAGHTRLKAAQQLGLKRVPVRYMDLDPADAHLLALADNRLNELSPWDTDELQKILGEYGLDDVGLAGWTSEDLDRMAGELLGDADDAKDDDGVDDTKGEISIIVFCDSEEHQRELLEKFDEMGLNSKALL